MESFVPSFVVLSPTRVTVHRATGAVLWISCRCAVSVRMICVGLIGGRSRVHAGCIHAVFCVVVELQGVDSRVGGLKNGREWLGLAKTLVGRTDSSSEVSSCRPWAVCVGWTVVLGSAKLGCSMSLA